MLFITGKINYTDLGHHMKHQHISQYRPRGYQDPGGSDSRRYIKNNTAKPGLYSCLEASVACPSAGFAGAPSIGGKGSTMLAFTTTTVMSSRRLSASLVAQRSEASATIASAALSGSAFTAQ